MPLKRTCVTSASRLSTGVTAGCVVSARFLRSTNISSRGYERSSLAWRISNFGVMRNLSTVNNVDIEPSTSRCSVAESSEPSNEFALSIETATHEVSLSGHRTLHPSNQ